MQYLREKADARIFRIMRSRRICYISFSNSAGVVANTNSSWAGYAQNNSTVWHQVPFEFIDDYSYSENGSRPSGENDFSWWAWTTTKASSVLLTIRHECKGKIVQTCKISGVTIWIQLLLG